MSHPSTVSLAVWTHVVPSEAMQHAVLLGRDSWMRFQDRSYRALPPRPGDNRVFSDLTLSLPGLHGAAAFVSDSSAPPETFNLFYAGSAGISRSRDDQLVKVVLVRSNGAPALVGCYLVDMLHSAVEIRLKNALSRMATSIPLTGVPELEPGALLGASSIPLPRVTLGAVFPDARAPALFPRDAGTHRFSVPCPATAPSEDPNLHRPAPPCQDPFVHHLRDETAPQRGESAASSSPLNDRSPSPDLLECLGGDQRASCLQVWDRLPPHMRELAFELHDSGWKPIVFTQLGDGLEAFPDILFKSFTVVGSCSLPRLGISVPPNSSPATSRPHRINRSTAKQVDVALDKVIAAGHIQHSTSPWANPVVVIQTKCCGVRITVNYKELHKVSILGQPPIPRVDVVNDKLGAGRIFSLFDLVPSFHQITVHKDTIPLIASSTPTRLLEWLVMPQGRSAARGWFVSVIKEVINGLDRVSAYLDHVIVFDAVLSAHLLNMKDPFQRLRKYNLNISPSKATIGATDVDFRGQTISPAGVKPNAGKVEVLKKMPMPDDTKQLHSLMSGIGFYRKFLLDLASQIRPLTFSNESSHLF